MWCNTVDDTRRGSYSRLGSARRRRRRASPCRDCRLEHSDRVICPPTHLPGGLYLHSVGPGARRGAQVVAPRPQRQDRYSWRRCDGRVGLRSRDHGYLSGAVGRTARQARKLVMLFSGLELPNRAAPSCCTQRVRPPVLDTVVGLGRQPLPRTRAEARAYQTLSPRRADNLSHGPMLRTTHLVPHVGN